MNEHVIQRAIVFIGLVLIMAGLFISLVSHIDKSVEQIKLEIRAAAKAGAPSAK